MRVTFLLVSKFSVHRLPHQRQRTTSWADERTTHGVGKFTTCSDGERQKTTQASAVSVTSVDSDTGSGSRTKGSAEQNRRVMERGVW